MITRFTDDAAVYTEIRRKINAAANKMALDIIQQLQTENEVVKKWDYKEDLARNTSSNFWDNAESRIDVCRTALPKIHQTHPNVRLDWKTKLMQEHYTWESGWFSTTYNPKRERLIITFSKN